MHPCACVSGRWPFWLYSLAPSLLCQRHVRVSSCADDFSCSWHVWMFFSAKHCVIWSTQNLALLCCRFIFMRMPSLLPMRRVPIYLWVVRYVAQTGIRLHARHLNPPQSGTWQSVFFCSCTLCMLVNIQNFTNSTEKHLAIKLTII